MEIDGSEHHVARQNERLERDRAAPVDTQPRFAADVEHAHRRDQLIGVVAAACDAGEVRVAQEVVHAIRVEVGAADDLAQHRIVRRTAGDQGEHFGPLHLERVDRRRNVGQRDDVGGAALVQHAEHGFARVAERTVPDVVQQQARAQQAPLRFEVGVVREILRRVAPQGGEDAFAGRERTERVAETRVFGRRIGHVRQAELAQPPQTLHRPHPEQGGFTVVEFDEVVDRIEDAFRCLALRIRALRACTGRPRFTAKSGTDANRRERHSRSRRAQRHRGGHRAVRLPAQARSRPRRAVPVSWREDAIVSRAPRPRILQVLRLRRRRRRHSLRQPHRERAVSRRGALAGAARRRRTRTRNAGDRAGAQRARSDLRGQRDRGRVLQPDARDRPGRRRRTGVLRSPRTRYRNDRTLPARLCTRPLGCARERTRAQRRRAGDGDQCRPAQAGATRARTISTAAG